MSVRDRLFLDKGLEGEKDGVQLLKPIPDFDPLLARAAEKGIFGTKMRLMIANADPVGIAAVVKQQFAIGRQILQRGLVPIIDPEVLIKSQTKERAEAILLEESLGSLQDSITIRR
ncbi:hypothetical protein [Sinorhizobium saheli]|uniref:Uncharacterized protein n=1 Tax=Sinorhizobium saheli TaxID=36856 RepID=A0A178YNV4_SINSA|nr:hypothetical protein [Sinorhizobium saheli]MQW88340.1 hypothetical protein [Sinorhizobium saheli]OAP48445.1 hypothetical protein ATB98_24150 [Sinorhizobium saheli]